jgi:hypothetical protein
MKREDIYRDWVEGHRQAEVHPDLVENVMREIRREQPIDERVPAWMRLVEWIDASTWLKAAAVGAVGVVALGRIVFGINLLLAFRLLGI